MTDNEMTDPDSGPTSSGQTTSMAPPLGPPQPASPVLIENGVPGGHRAGTARRRLVLGLAAMALIGSGAAGGAAIALNSPGGSTSPAVSAIGPSTPQGSSGASGGQFSGGGGVPQFNQSDLGSTSGTAYSPESTANATAAQSVGLVEITSTLANGTGAGTGLILSPDGTVVTNHHVVAGATSIKVRVVSTGQTYTATYIGGDATADVAVLKLVGARGLTPVTIANTAARAGDKVTAIGDAGGDGGSLTAAPGTVAALGQNITVGEEDGSSSSLTELIEMNADVVPGDSGGAVRNAADEVVGMNVAASTGSSNVTGYAIPIATVSKVASEILAGQASSTVALGYSGYLGVGLDPASEVPLVAELMNGGAASAAGIKVGATITKLNGTAITSGAQLRALLAKASPGDSATVTWKTARGVTRSATLQLGTAPIA